MSDLIARKNLKIKDSSDAKSKNIEATKDKLSALTPRASDNENDESKSFSIRSGSALKTLRIAKADEEIKSNFAHMTFKFNSTVLYGDAAFRLIEMLIFIKWQNYHFIKCESCISSNQFWVCCI